MWGASIVASALCALMLLAEPALAAKRVALVIGNSSYQNVVKLTNPSNDAEAMAATLKAAGFEFVDLKRDLKAVELRRALRDFADRSRDADIALLYFAGHGIEIDGTNYIIPTDALLERDIDAYDEAISLDRLLTVIEPAKRLRLVILDACRDNPFSKIMKRTKASRAIDRGLARVEPSGSNTLVAFAAKAGSTAADGDSRNSPFTAALIKYLPRPGLDLRKAFGFVRDDVLKATNNRQEPFLYGSLGGDDLALVEPAAPSRDTEPEIRRAYELALQISTPDVWASFIATYPQGFYSDLAKAQSRRLMEEAARSAAAVEQSRTAADKAASVRAAEDAKAAEALHARQLAEARAQEKVRLAAEEAAKVKAAEEARLAEQARVAAEKKAREEEAARAAQARVAAQKAAEAERARQAAEAKAKEQAQLAAEQAAKAKAAEEAKAAELTRVAAEKKAREDAARAAEARAAEQKAAEAERARQAAEAKAKEQAQFAAEQAAKAKAAEEAKAAELARVAAEKKAREEAARAAEARAAEQKAAEAERARQVAEAKAKEQAQLAAEQAAKAKAAEEAKAAELTRVAAEKKAREEAARAAEARAAEQKAAEAERARQLAEAKAKDQEQEQAAKVKAAEEARAAGQTRVEAAESKLRDPKEATQLAALAPQADVAKSDQTVASDIPRLLQAELRRVGCLKAEISGSWSDTAQKSLELFNKNAGTAFNVKLASLDALDSVRSRPARVCPLLCEHGFRRSGEQCVRISCEAGYELGDDNTCERNRAKRPARRDAPAVAARPPAERPAASESQPSASPGQKRGVKDVEALWSKCSNNGQTGRNNRTFASVNACVMRGM